MYWARLRAFDYFEQSYNVVSTIAAGFADSDFKRLQSIEQAVYSYNIQAMQPFCQCLRVLCILSLHAPKFSLD